MAIPRPPEKAAFFSGILAAGAELLPAAREALEGAFGPARMASGVFPFAHTEYYRDELGEAPVRMFLAWTEPYPTDALAGAKRATNALESELARRFGGGRPINLDPGYLTQAKLVLASAKNFAHRIHLRDNIYAELTLQYRHGRFHALPWTFPDFADDRYHPFFLALREKIHGTEPSLLYNPSMARETEAKIPVPDLPAIHARLLALGAEDRGEVFERNRVLDDADGSLARRGMLLRVRTHGAEKGGLLTVKHVAGGGAFKTREEIETVADDAETLLRQLAVLGYRVAGIYEKRRRTLLRRGCVVSLDECPELGAFVEIEGDEAGIRAVCGEIGLNPLDHLGDSYLALWRNHLAARGEPPRDMTFDHKGTTA